MNGRKIRFTTGAYITLEQLKELLSVLETQNTTDADMNCDIHMDGNEGIYDYTCDEEGNVTVKGVSA